MMKKITLLLLLVTACVTSWAQQVIFEESFTTFTTLGEAPPAGWITLDEDGQPVNSFYTDQGIFTSNAWEHSNFGDPYSTGIFSCSGLDSATGPVSNYLISPLVALQVNPSMEVEIVASVPGTLELRSASTIAGATPVASDFTNLITTFNTTQAYTVNSEDLAALSGQSVYFALVDNNTGGDILGVKNFKVFEENITKWKEYLNNVYIWDYAVNFDNYFDIYPSLKVTQQNLKLYKKLGIKGVFIHGSEYEYSTFQDLKSTILAKLLWDTNIDIDKEINAYFNSKFSKKLANSLSNYYSFIDNSFFLNKNELSIYSGIGKSVKKYLDPKVFFSFYNEFDLHTQTNKYDKDYLRIATALTFLKLEIMRDSGIGTYGFATLNNNKEIIVKNEAALLLDKLNAYSKSANLTTYNERNYQIDDYINSWRKTIYKYHKRKHYFYKKPFEVLSKLDEDYTDITVLNDAAFGLKDYNTNWHINSLDNLVLKIDKLQITKSKQITFSFLQDSKHHIFYPSSIEILDTDFKLIKKHNLIPDNTIVNPQQAFNPHYA